MAYSEHSLKAKSNRKLITDWAYEQGVFETPQGKFIARVIDNGVYKTLSQHKTKQEAIDVWESFYFEQ